jgi:hypothetical protein
VASFAGRLSLLYFYLKQRFISEMFGAIFSSEQRWGGGPGIKNTPLSKLRAGCHLAAIERLLLQEL